MINYLRVSCDVKTITRVYLRSTHIQKWGSWDLKVLKPKIMNFCIHKRNQFFDKGKLQQLIDRHKEIYQVYIPIHLETIEQKNWNEKSGKKLFSTNSSEQ